MDLIAPPLSVTPSKPSLLTRRRFLKLAAAGTAGVAAAGLGYSFYEAGSIRVTRVEVTVPRLPRAFVGKTVALLVDLHHGPCTSLNLIRTAVNLAQGEAPDLVALCGDYVDTSVEYAAPCIRELGRLSAPLGCYFVLGNHEWRAVGPVARAAMRECGVTDLTNRGVWLYAGGERLRVAGVGDLWSEKQDLCAALGDTHAAETCLLLCHNPDYVETLRDPRVGLVLSGHTHGGQVQLPFLGAPIIYSSFGQKYREGLVRTPFTQVYVSRGIGTIRLPLRFRCPPEVCILKLAV